MRYTGFEDRLVFRLELYTLLQALYGTVRSGSSVRPRVIDRHSSISWLTLETFVVYTKNARKAVHGETVHKTLPPCPLNQKTF